MTPAAASTFGERLFAKPSQEAYAYQVAQETADANDCPVAMMLRDGWLAIIEEPPDDAECDPFGHGWQMVALINPTE